MQKFARPSAFQAKRVAYRGLLRLTYDRFTQNGNSDFFLKILRALKTGSIGAERSHCHIHICRVINSIAAAKNTACI